MGHRSKKARWLAVAAAVAMTYLTYAARRAEVEQLQFLARRLPYWEKSFEVMNKNDSSSTHIGEE